MPSESVCYVSCHQKCIVHRDLKAENPLTDAAILGLQRQIHLLQQATYLLWQTPFYHPQDSSRVKKYNLVGVWSLEVIPCTFDGFLPFVGQKLKEL